MAIHLGRRLPDGSSGLPGVRRAGRPPPAWPCSRWGLPSRPGHPGRWCALTAPFHPYLCTGSEEPVPSAVCSLLRCPAGRPDWVLPSTVPCGVRTFLGTGHAGPRPPGRLATDTSLRRRSNLQPRGLGRGRRRVVPAASGRTSSEEAAEHPERGRDHEVTEDLPGAQAGQWPVKRPRFSSRTQPDHDADRDPEHERADAGEGAVGEGRLGHEAPGASPPSA